MNEKKKIIIPLESQIYIRNYLETKAFKEIEKNYECIFIAQKKIIDKKFKGKIKYFYSITSLKEKLNNFFFNVTTFRFRKLSKTFKFRLKLINSIGFDRDKNGKIIFSKVSLKRIFVLFKFNIYNIIFGNLVFYTLLNFFFTKILSSSDVINDIIQKEKPELILYPTCGFETSTLDFLKISKKNKIKSIFLIDNWDNLSSKMVFPILPKKIYVWGKQSQEHAINIHNFEKKNVEIIGTPRFDVYKKRLKVKKIKKKYILFLGQFLPYNEEEVLNYLEDIISNNYLLKNCKIIYRPHPWRSETNNINFKNFKNVILDPQIEKHFKKRLNFYKSRSFQPNLNYYSSLIKNSHFVISGATSMVLESLIMKKKVILLGNDDKKNYTTMKTVLNTNEHFFGIEKIKNISICSDLSKLEKKVLSFYKSPKFQKCKKINYFLYFNKNKSYSSILYNKISNEL